MNANDFIEKLYNDGSLSPYYLSLYRRTCSKAEFSRLGEKTTVCLLTCNNGFEMVGTSACVHVDDYDPEIGQKCALKDALVKLDPFDGYSRTELNYLTNKLK